MALLLSVVPQGFLLRAGCFTACRHDFPTDATAVASFVVAQYLLHRQDPDQVENAAFAILVSSIPLTPHGEAGQYIFKLAES